MGRTILEMENISKSFGATQALSGIGFSQTTRKQPASFPGVRYSLPAQLDRRSVSRCGRRTALTDRAYNERPCFQEYHQRD